MRKSITFLTSLFVLLALFLSACGVLTPRTGNSGGVVQGADATRVFEAAVGTATQQALLNQISQLQTQVAQPQNTQAAGEPVVVTATPGPIQPTNTNAPTATPVPPTNTPEPTATPVPPTATPVPVTATPTNTPTPCNAAQFVGDVTIPDGTKMQPGQTFTKTWRLKNVGSCTWTNTYDLVFFSGESLNAPSAVDFPGNVVPGQVIDLSVTLTAPSAEGTYKGNWKLRDPAGVLFGLHPSGNPFFVVIKVVAPVSQYPLDFAATVCQAQWTSGAGSLNCPSPENDSRGFVFRVDKPTLENGSVDDEPALVMSPQMITDGVIRGKFPSYKVQSTDKFLAVIGCARGYKSCDVNFQLDYQIGDGSIQTLKTWHEVYDEQINGVSVDLSSLAGKDVKFILTIFANGAATDDRAQWLAPRIVH